jgi:hypothetical protein
LARRSSSRVPEGVASDDRFNAAFGRATTFVDPRRAMLGVRLHLGR